MKKHILSVAAAATLLSSVVAFAGQDIVLHVTNKTDGLLRTTTTNDKCMIDLDKFKNFTVAPGAVGDVKFETKNRPLCSFKTSGFRLNFHKAGIDTPVIGYIDYTSSGTGNCATDGRHCFTTSNATVVTQPSIQNGDPVNVYLSVNNP